MSWLPTGTRLGELALIETFIDFDGPRVFSCRSLTDQTYIAAWAAERDTDDLWLYVPVSVSRLTMVRSGGIPLRSAFEQPEDVVYLVTLQREDLANDSAASVAVSDLLDDWLPEPDFQLDLDTPTLPAAEPGQLWRRQAIQENRGRLRLEVKLPRTTRSEAPTRKVGELLVSTQALFDNIGLAILRDNPPQAGPIPLEIAEQTATDLIGLSAASFVVNVASTNFDDLLGDSTFSEIAKRILGLLDTTLDRDELISQLVELSPRGAKSFRNFVKTLASTGADITVAGAANNLDYTAREWSSDRLGTLSQILSILVPEDVYSVRGRMRLFRGDTERKQFGVKDELTDARYEGGISERALPQVHLAPLDDTYEVLISEYSNFDEAVGERKPIYILDQLTQVDPSTPHEPTTRTRITDSSLDPSPEN
jgi:hypothetical protein